MLEHNCLAMWCLMMWISSLSAHIIAEAASGKSVQASVPIRGFCTMSSLKVLWIQQVAGARL